MCLRSLAVAEQHDFRAIRLQAEVFHVPRQHRPTAFALLPLIDHEIFEEGRTVDTDIVDPSRGLEMRFRRSGLSSPEQKENCEDQYVFVQSDLLLHLSSYLEQLNEPVGDRGDIERERP